jgi:hypothetical protein
MFLRIYAFHAFNGIARHIRPVSNRGRHTYPTSASPDRPGKVEKRTLNWMEMDG